MPQHYEGSFEVTAPPGQVFRFLTDPRKVLSAIPDIESIEVNDPTSFTLKARVGISFIRGSITMKFTLLDSREPSYAKLVGKGSGINSTVDMETSFTIEEKGDGSLVRWSVDVKLGGLLAGMGSHLIEPIASKYITQIITGIKEKLS